jgi:hypothetical protein
MLARRRLALGAASAALSPARRMCHLGPCPPCPLRTSVIWITVLIRTRPGGDLDHNGSWQTEVDPVPGQAPLTVSRSPQEIRGSHAQKHQFCNCCHDVGFGDDFLGRIQRGPGRDCPIEGWIVVSSRHTQLIPAGSGDQTDLVIGVGHEAANGGGPEQKAGIADTSGSREIPHSLRCSGEIEGRPHS